MEKPRYVAGMLLLLALCTMAHAETYTCDSCSDCTTKIGSASYGDVVQLTADISSTDMDCITFTGKTGVSLDCQGHSLEGNQTDYGIYLNTGSGNTVKNCVVTSYSHGIHLYNSDSNTIMNNTVNSNRFIGIYALSSDENTFDENVASYNNGGGGIFLAYCQRNTVSNNEADQNSEYGIQLYFSANSTLTGNTVSLNRYGIYLMYSSDNTANLNYACSQNVSDFYIGGTSTNSGDDNTCTTDGGWNDTGTSGCTYGCPGTTTTTTTTSSTTTTINGCSSCTNCNAAIASASQGETVYLEANISGLTTECIVFDEKSGVTFDCQGNRIEGDSPIESGINITQGTDNAVRNCYLSGFMNGIKLDSSNRTTLADNTLNNNSLTGIFVWESHNNTITGNVAYHTLGSGISLHYSNDNTVTGNTQNFNINGIMVSNSDRNTFTGNEVCENTNLDFYAYESSSNEGVDNKCDMTGGWDDTGTSGCTYSCSETTTSTSTTVTSTSTSTSTSTTVTLPENMCWSEDMGFLYRTKYQARKFCKCAMGTYGYETYSESSGERATYSYVDTGDNDEWETSCSEEYNQIFRVKCTDSVWYYTDEDYFIPTSSTSTSTTSSTTASSTTTSTTMPCSLAGDYPPCDEILLSEIVAHINLWAAGEAPLAEVVALVNAWAS